MQRRGSVPRPITVHPELVINHTDTFLVTGRDGQVRGGRHGLYHRDVRYLARYGFSLNGAEPTLVSAAAIDFHLSRAFFTNPRLGGYRTELRSGEVLLVLDRTIDGAGLHEDWSITSYSTQEARFTLSLAFDATFEDVFEVRAGTSARGRIVFGRWEGGDQRLTYRYRDRDYSRGLEVRLTVGSDDLVRYAGDQVEVDLRILPRGEWWMCTDLNFESGADTHGLCARRAGSRRLEPHGLVELPSLASENADLHRAWGQARVDLSALHLSRQGERWFPSAGVPWYVAVFGRDSLIASYQAVSANPGLAIGTLLTLAELQADASDPEREAEPGKIPHELRVGELAHFRRIPHTPVYASADATLLYPILLHETWSWLGDRELVERCLPVAERCLEWALRYGDRDHDGLQEYAPHTPRGYAQMGWKDSPDSVVDADGTLARHPIALVELQGYWYDALVRMAELREAFGGSGADLRETADALRRKVEALYWMEEEGTYAFALDGEKRQVRGVASNPGHLLWSGLPSPERARRVARRLLAEDLWTGWGIRTLSDRNPAYNPISYHRGSVWPHDNSLICAGMRRYGLSEEPAVVAEGLVAASGRFEGGSLPELWAGVARWPSDFPVLYLDANRPHAWSAGAILLLVRTVLGLRVEPLRRRLIVDPAIPRSFGRLTLEDLPVLGATVSLTCRGEELEVTRVRGDVEVVRAAG